MTDKEARERELTGLPFTIVVGELDKPCGFIERSPKCYGVNFLDMLARVYLIYTFEEIEPGRLFLKEAIFFQFSGVSDSPAQGTMYWFQHQGRVTIESVDYSTSKTQRLEKETELLGNWENKPEFGCYDRLLVVKRLPESPPSCL